MYGQDCIVINFLACLFEQCGGDYCVKGDGVGRQGKRGPVCVWGLSRPKGDALYPGDPLPRQEIASCSLGPSVAFQAQSEREGACSLLNHNHPRSFCSIS